MHEAIIVRSLTAKDVNAVLSQLGGIDEFVVNLAEPDAWTRGDLESWLAEEGELCSGAFQRGQLVGFCLAYLHRATCKLHIENVFVEPSSRRQQLGRKLLQRTVESARAICKERVRVVALVKGSNTRAQAFFEAAGLRAGESMVWHQRNLDPPGAYEDAACSSPGS